MANNHDPHGRTRMACDIQGWAEAMVLWAYMIYGEHAYQRVYDQQAGREVFLLALPRDIQDAILTAAREWFPPHGPPVHLN